MIKWAPFPFVRFTLAFIAGILLGTQFPAVKIGPLFLIFGSLVMYAGLFLFARSRRSAAWVTITGVAGLLSLVILGFSLVHLRTQTNQPEHLIHRSGQVTHYQGYLNDFLLEKPTVFQNTLRLQKVKINGQWQAASGQVQLTFRKTSGLEKPAYGDILLIKGMPQLVPEPLNPGQFNYRQYLGNRQIYHQQFLEAGQFIKTGKFVANPVLAFSIKLRSYLNLRLKASLDSPREYGIASALVLGIKDELDNSVKAAYTNTGTIHVLAVSGLHVGMLFYLLTFSLKKLGASPREKWLKALLILGIIWTYAFITALSPSVLRATVMFTFIVGADLVGRKGNIYNTLAAAAFLLLLFNPFYLFEVGFQLSFLAVLAIVFLQPKLYFLLTFNNRILDYIWTLITVSVAAQLGTVFLSLAYFHQFPVYFLVSNLVAVPMAGVILGGGFALLLLGRIPYVGAALGYGLEKLVWLMNELMLHLESWPGAVISRIPFTGWQAALSYGFLFLVLVFLARKKLPYLVVAGLVLLIFTGTRFAARQVAVQPKLVLLAVPKSPVWVLLENNTATVLADSAFINDKKTQNFVLEPMLLKAQVQKTSFLNWQDAKEFPEALHYQSQPELSVMVWRGRSFLILDKPVKPNLKKKAAVEFLVLRHNVWFDPENLRRNFRFRMVIIDSGNAPWYRKRAAEQLRAAHLPFRDPAVTGALEFSSSHP